MALFLSNSTTKYSTEDKRMKTED